MTLQRTIALCLGLAFVGCGGTMPNGTRGNGGDTGGGGGGGGGGGVTVPNGTGTITGTMNGYTVATPRSVISVVTASSVSVYLSDRADLCTILQAGGTPKTSTFFRFGVSAGMPKTWA